MLDESEKLRWTGPSARYQIAGLLKLITLKRRSGKIIIDGVTIECDRFSYFCSINTPYCGREKIVYPDSLANDGKWEVSYCLEISRAELFNLMSQMTKNDGSWFQRPSKTNVSHQTLELAPTDGNDTINLDGEDNVSGPIRVEILKQNASFISYISKYTE